MPEEQNNPPNLRMLAPTALVIVGIAFLLIVFTSGGSDDSADSGPPPAAAQPPKPSKKREEARKPSAYVVKVNDSLPVISERTKVSVEKLQEYNPGLDPQALVPGQKLKLKP